MGATSNWHQSVRALHLLLRSRWNSGQDDPSLAGRNSSSSTAVSSPDASQGIERTQIVQLEDTGAAINPDSEDCSGETTKVELDDMTITTHFRPLPSSTKSRRGSAFSFDSYYEGDVEDNDAVQLEVGGCTSTSASTAIEPRRTYILI